MSKTVRPTEQEVMVVELALNAISSSIAPRTENGTVGEVMVATSDIVLNMLTAFFKQSMQFEQHPEVVNLKMVEHLSKVMINQLEENFFVMELQAKGYEAGGGDLDVPVRLTLQQTRYLKSQGWDIIKDSDNKWRWKHRGGDKLNSPRGREVLSDAEKLFQTPVEYKGGRL